VYRLARSEQIKFTDLQQCGSAQGREACIAHFALLRRRFAVLAGADAKQKIKWCATKAAANYSAAAALAAA
jgi:hypothetical protein